MISPREDYGGGGPVQSDTEFETNKDRDDTNVDGVTEDRKQSWKWGELPTTTSAPDHDTKHHCKLTYLSSIALNFGSSYLTDYYF